MTQDEGDLAEVVRRERQLLDPALRADGEFVAGLLHRDYVEYGASGRVWDREGVVAALQADPGVPAEATGFEPVRLAGDVVLLTFRLNGDRPSLRCSVWVREPGSGWRLRFHQGTRTSSAGESSAPA